MKFKKIGKYKYNDQKEFNLYEDENKKKYLEKSTSILNYNILRQISEIASENDNLLSISTFYKKDENTINYLIEFISGTTIEKLINEGYKFSNLEIKEIFYQLCLALRELHKNNIIHRDIKPDNVIMLPDGKIILIDFDISREYKEEKSIDTTFAGTRGYASPEQYGYMQTTTKSDIYSLGLTMKKILENTKDEDQYFFKSLIKKAISIDPNDRYCSIDEIIKILELNYPNFFESQLSQIKSGEDSGLYQEQIEIYADRKYNAKQMGVIKHALLENVDEDVLELIKDSNLSSRQMWQIKEGYLDNLIIQEIKLYAKPIYLPEEMGIYRNGLRNKINQNQIHKNIKTYQDVLHNYTFSVGQLSKIRYAFYIGIDSNLINVIINENLSVEQMEAIINILKGENNEIK